jgi:uncharacterized metal-binding protein YceD (DUF177 family)
MSNPPILESEWSEFFDVTKIKDSGNRLTIEANEEQCKNLARRYGIQSLNNLSAKLYIKQINKNRFIHITGTLQANLIQECIISRDPVKTHITEDFESWFADAAQILSLDKARREKAIKNGEELPILEEHEDPETFENNNIDIGELVAQHLSLAIPPYPRAEGAQYEGPTLDAGKQEPAFDNPFAKLAEWKDKLDGQ